MYFGRVPCGYVDKLHLSFHAYRILQLLVASMSTGGANMGAKIILIDGKVVTLGVDLVKT